MLRGYILRYLATVATGSAPVDALAKIPGLLRPLVKRAAQKRVIAAGFATSRAEDTAHLHRLAYLAIVRVPVADDDDVAGVQQAFVDARRPRVEAGALMRLVAGVSAILALAVGAGAVWLWANLPESHPASADQHTPDAGADLDELLGMDEPAEPAHPLDAVFGEALPELVVALDRRSSGDERPPPHDVATERSELLDALRADAPELVEPMDALVAEALAYVDREDGHDDASWLNQLVLFHDALHEADVPYYVDATLRSYASGRHQVLLSTWNVSARRTFRAGDREVRALDITRRDNLNFERSLLGYTRPEVRYALVVVDRIERFLVEDVLPTVSSARDSVIVRDYADETGTEWVTPFEDQAHEDLRDEAERIVRAEMGNARALDRLADAIVRRRNAVAMVSGSLEGVELREPWRYDYDVSRLSFRRDVDRAGLRQLRRAEADLHQEDVLRAWQLLLEARAISVAEHEVQHRLDYEDDRLIAVPEVLSKYTGETEALDGANRRAERANAELSAYLSQIAQRPDLAWTSLVHVASFIMNRHSWGMPEAYSAVALFESLADEAGIAHPALIADRRIDRGATARIYAALRDSSSEELSALAARAWQRLYGAELVEITSFP
jgi:hypothetical protein